ncbi:MAG: FAD-dependent oxidoreductase [Planctomycetota bacterium]|nr:FAD-dependent oxidoreductase [Planctomycetota bacterium]
MSNTPHPRFPWLFSPFTFHGVTLKNRIGISGHFAGWWVTDGLPNEDFAAYIEERAKGGIGFFMIGATATVLEGGPDWFLNLDDRIIPSYRMCAEAGQRHGTKVFAQLLHRPDRKTPRNQLAGTEPPDDTPDRTVEEIQRLAQSFGPAARRAREAGLDGVELHAHEGFLFYQFLSLRFNGRTDQYGGPLENRMRFMVETLQAMRNAVGEDFPLGVRLSADDQEEGGNTVEDSIEVARRLEAMNLVNYLSYTGGDREFHHGPMARPAAEWVPFVGRIKSATKLPVMHAGRITTPDTAEQALAEGKLDVALMTKANIADPHFARKAREGRLDDIRFCTRCVQSCIGDMANMTCVYNPVTSREREWAELRPAEQRKKVVIVGAGPAGMEAALAAHGRGHEVVVLEKSDRIGGQVHLASASPLRANFIRIVKFYQRQAAKGLFDVRLSTEADAEYIQSLSPDAAVIATGSVPIRSEVPGGGRVWTVHDAFTCKDIHELRRAVVVDRHGFMEALASADYLSALGIAIEFITPLNRIVPKVDGLTRSEMLRQLEHRGINFSDGEETIAWDGDEVLLRKAEGASERTLNDIDAVIVSAGSVPVNELASSLRDRVAEIHTIGDANIPQTVTEATFQGGNIGRLL